MTQFAYQLARCVSIGPVSRAETGSMRLRKNGGADEDRTRDLYNAIVALSQLSYGPILFAVITA